MKMQLNFVERSLRRFFFHYGGFIADHPLVFLILPVLIAAALTSGIVFITSEEDVGNLYIPDNAQSKTDRKIIRRLYRDFDADAERPAAFVGPLSPTGQIIIRPKDGDNVLTTTVIQEAIRLHDLILNISAQDTRSRPTRSSRRSYYPVLPDSYTFYDLCWRWEGECNYGGSMLQVIGDEVAQVDNRTFTYPFAATPSGEVRFIGYDLGGISFKPDSEDELQSAGLLLITYPLKYEGPGEIWENEFLKHVSQFESDIIEVFVATSQVFNQDIQAATDEIYPYIALCFAILISFAIGSTTSLDNVRSKPWLGALGVVSSFLAIGSGFGVMAYAGIPFAFAVTSSPFLVLGKYDHGDDQTTFVTRSLLDSPIKRK